MAAVQDARVPKKITAHEFVVVDEDGKIRAQLRCLEEYGPTLELYDENGKGRALLSCEKTGPALTLRDENGNGPALNLYDDSEKTRATFGCAELETTSTGVTTQRPENAIVLYGPDGKVVFKAPGK